MAQIEACANVVKRTTSDAYTRIELYGNVSEISSTRQDMHYHLIYEPHRSLVSQLVYHTCWVD